MIVCGAAPDGRPAPIIEIASLSPGEQLAFGENRWVWLNTSVQISVSYVPDARGRARSAPVVNRSLLDPRAGIEGTENVRMPVAPAPGPRMSPSAPVVDRIGLVPVFVIVAVPVIQLPDLRNEIWRTENGDGCAAVRTPARFAEAPAPTGALAVNASERHTPTALISASRRGRRAPARHETRLSTDRYTALNVAAINTVCLPLASTSPTTSRRARQPVPTRLPPLGPRCPLEHSLVSTGLTDERREISRIDHAIRSRPVRPPTPWPACPPLTNLLRPVVAPAPRLPLATELGLSVDQPYNSRAVTVE
jgi:hypothetical protein